MGFHLLPKYRTYLYDWHSIHIRTLRAHEGTVQVKQPVNPNYCASVVSLNKFVPIENANAIKCAIIFGNSVIVSINTELTTKGLYFPLECALSPDFISKHNLYRDKSLNEDQTQAGFFEQNGRVRALRLRGTKSEGFFMTFDQLHESYAELKELEVGTDFDMYNDKWLCLEIGRAHV